MSKKKLDELFQDRFKDFIEVPDDRVWASIEASLDKKKKKRILPLWWYLGGIAATLLIAMFVFNPFNKETSVAPIITDVEQQQKDTLQNIHESSKILDLDTKNTNKVASEEEKGKSIKSDGKSPQTKTQHNLAKENSAVAQTPKAVKTKDTNFQVVKKNPVKSNVDLAGTKEEAQLSNQKDKTTQNPIIEEKITFDKKEQAVATNNVDSRVRNDAENKVSDINKLEGIGLENKESQITQNQAKQDTDSTELANKKSIFDEIDNQQEEAIAKTSSKKWSAGPSVAPVYFNAMGEGSSVHSIFVPNSKSGNVNMSYGMSVGYEISPKLRVRSGIHRVDYGYDTNDIAFSSSPIASTNGQIDNINYRITSKNLVVSSKPGGSAREQAPSNSLDASSLQEVERDGIMTQQMGYLEIPLELNYALIDKKFGLNLIGGVSSLFLVDNTVALTSGDLTTEMGDANNLNSLNFSANFGLGVNYKFSQNWHLNIEPVFKYQLNTFSQTDGTFNPYALGVYSGLNFRF